MTPTKACATCGNPFDRNPKYGAAQWDRAQFCSNACRGLSIRTRRFPLCACGCGQAVRKANATWRQGHNPQDHRIKVWQVQTTRGKTRWFTTDRNGKRVQWAHVVMEDKIGRAVRPGEIVHHVNGDSCDDRPENLELFASHSDHMRHEWRVGNLRRARDGGSYKAR